MEKGKIKNILLTIIIVILILLLGYLLYDKFLSKRDKVSNNQNILTIYGYENSNSKVACQGQNIECDQVISTIKVNNQNANIIHIWNNYVLYFDDKMKVYDVNSDEIKELDIDISEEEINRISYLTDDYYYLENGFLFSYNGSKDNSKKQEYYYDVKNNKKMFSEYSLLERIKVAQSNNYSNKYIQGIKDDAYFLLDVETGKSILDRKPAQVPESVRFEEILGCAKYDGLLSSYLQEMVSQPYNYIIYDKDGKIINKLDKDEMYIADNCQNGSDIFIYKKDRTYDIKGNLKK